ncbi:MAG: outer membrane lipoprotein-sorting protein [candidate division Zixibacteria bacterium]|nr:outer membrane lipoprotein-sorting protein [candidate division Zixibacteria bacterium]
MSNRLLKFTMVASIIILYAIPSTAGMTCKRVMELIREKNDSKTQVTTISMKLIDQKGRTQNKGLKIYAEQIGDTQNVLTRFVAPKRAKGIGFLVSNESGNNNRYLYTPSDKKTRKVPEGDNHKSFQGTDFTYYDLSPHDVNEDSYDALKIEKYDGHDCYVCTSKPKNASDAPYGKVVQWIRKDIYVPVLMKFYDPDGKFLKESKAVEINQVDSYWTPMKTVMHNVQIDHKTVMEVKNINFNKKLPDKIFTKTYLESGR